MTRAEALKQSLKFYDSGILCPRSHGFSRRVSDRSCPECKREWSARNPDKDSSAKKDWKRNNPEKVKAQKRLDALRFRQRHPDKKIAEVRQRKYSALNRAPAWADKNAIREVYRECQETTKISGVIHHVDHEIPLHGRLVSGLHVHTNLRVIPAAQNLSKANAYG